jgi:hypothetical protein
VRVPDFYLRDYAARRGTRELLGQSTKAESPEAVSGAPLLLV